MKIFKALQKPSTGEYWVFNNIYDRYMPSDIPHLLDNMVVMSELKRMNCIPKEAGDDIELVEIVVMEKSDYGKVKGDFLKANPLQLLFRGKSEIKKVRQIIEKAGENYVLDSKDAEYRKDNDFGDELQINITCPTTNFANAYYHIGAQVGKEILSKRKTKTKK